MSLARISVDCTSSAAGNNGPDLEWRFVLPGDHDRLRGLGALRGRRKELELEACQHVNDQPVPSGI